MGKRSLFALLCSVALLLASCQGAQEPIVDINSDRSVIPSEVSSQESSSELDSSVVTSSKETSSKETPSSKEAKSPVSSKVQAPSSKAETPLSKPPASSAPPVVSEEKPPANTNDKAEASDSPSGYADVENEILRLMNELRESLGVAPLEKSKRLSDVAYIRSKELYETDHFDHTRPDGTSYTTAFDQAGYEWSTAGENIGFSKGYSSDQLASMMFQSWKASQGHYENMIAEKYTQVGISIYFDGTTCYATQSFGTPKQ